MEEIGKIADSRMIGVNGFLFCLVFKCMECCGLNLGLMCKLKCVMGRMGKSR